MPEKKFAKGTTLCLRKVRIEGKPGKRDKSSPVKHKLMRK